MHKYHVTYRGEFETTVEATDAKEAVEVACKHEWYTCSELHPAYFEVEEEEDGETT